MRRRTFLTTTAAGTALVTTTGIGTAGTDAPGDTEFTVRGISHGLEPHTAVAEIRPTEVELAGTIPGVTTCLDATLVDTGVEDGTLSVTVERTYPDGGCRLGFRSLDYEAVVPVDEPVEAVAVEHVDPTAAEVWGRDDLTTNPATSTFRIGGTHHDSTNATAVTRRGGTLSVEGTIVGANGCATASLAGVYSDGYVVRVDVETDVLHDDDEFCTQALVGIDYETTIPLGHRPEYALVYHDDELVHSAAVDPAGDTTVSGADDTTVSGADDTTVTGTDDTTVSGADDTDRRSIATTRSDDRGGDDDGGTSVLDWIPEPLGRFLP